MESDEKQTEMRISQEQASKEISADFVRGAPASLMHELKQRINVYESTLALKPGDPALYAALQSPAWEVRSAAIEALGANGDPLSLSTVQEAIHDEHPIVRLSAIHTLGKYGTTVPLTLLIRSAQDSDWQVRDAAERALEAFQASSQTAEQLFTLTVPPARVKARGSERQQHGMLSLHTLLRRSYSASKIPIHSLRAGILLIPAALLLVVLTAASFYYGWWNPAAGDINLYQTIGQQQSSHGVSIQVVKAYADEGRTILVYTIISPKNSKSFVVASFDLHGSVPQKHEEMLGTQCDAAQMGMIHCYMIESAFLVPATSSSFTITWDIYRLLGGGGTGQMLEGSWHFAFRLAFHHENRHDIPLPFHGDIMTPQP